MPKGLLKLKRSVTRMRKLIRVNRRGEDEPLATISKAETATSQAVRVGLTFDALAAVMPFLETRKDVLSMMCTCRDLYMAGIPTLLSFEVVLQSCADIMSFCSFMFVDLPCRAYGLRSLSLKAAACDQEHDGETNRLLELEFLLAFGGGYPTEYIGPHTFLTRFLFKILQQSHRLESLYATNLEDWLRADHQLLTAIAHHDSLQTLLLGVHSGDTATQQLLEHLHGPISRIDLDFSLNPSIPFSPNWCLAALPDSMRVLHLTYISQPLTMGPQYHGMKVLSLKFWRFLDAEVLVHMFPGLVEFSCQIPDSRNMCPSALRQRNRLAHSRTTWNNLRLLQGDITSLYALGFNRPIRTLQVTAAGELDKLPWLFAVLNDAQPMHFCFTTTIEALNRCANFGDLSEAARSRLTELHIRLSTLDRSERKDQSRLVGLFKFLHPFTSVTHLSIITHFTMRLKELDAQPTEADSLAQCIASACPRSIQYFALQQPILDTTSWLVSRRDNEYLAQVERISMDARSNSWPMELKSAPHDGYTFNRFHRVSDN